MLQPRPGISVSRNRLANQEGGQFPGIGTIDLRVDYLRPGRGNHFLATGRVVRRGVYGGVTFLFPRGRCCFPSPREAGERGKRRET